MRAPITKWTDEVGHHRSSSTTAISFLIFSLFVILFFFFSFLLLLMWRRAPSTSRRQLVPDAVDISKRPSVLFFISFSFFSLHSEARENTGQGPTHYTVVYTVHNYYLCPSLAVFLCVLLLSSLGCIYAVAKTHHSLNYSIWTRDFSPVFFWGLLVFSRIPFGTLHRHPPPPFFSVWHCQQSIWELAYIFSLIFLLNGKTSFFFILKFKNGRFVPVSGRSISITIK